MDVNSTAFGKDLGYREQILWFYHFVAARSELHMFMHSPHPVQA